MKGAVRRAGLDRAARLQRGGRSPALLARFRELADEAYRLEVHVVIVHDGSTDDTAAVALRETNRGLAETFMRGMTEAARRAAPGEFVICMDADNSSTARGVRRITIVAGTRPEGIEIDAGALLALRARPNRRRFVVNRIRG